MRILSLFSGAGGSCLGWHAAGAEHALCCEWDASAGATLAAAGFPWSSVDLSDPEALRAALSPLAGSVDVLEASPPCQAWSSAGSRLGARDPRNGWPWTWEACDMVRPRWLVAENVPGLLSHRGDCPTRAGGYAKPMACPGCYWSEVVLEEARRRFSWVGWWLLDAADYGVPQHRRRVFLVGGPRQVSPPKPTHGEPATLRQRGLFGRRRLPWVTMTEALQLGASTGGNLMIERPAPAVTAQEVKGTRASAASGYTFNGGPDRASDMLFMATGRRRLTVEEVATLQGFPADHPWKGTKVSRYRQVGNAVPPQLAEAVARAVMGADDDL